MHTNVRIDFSARKGRGRLPGLAHATMRILPLAPLEVAANAMMRSVLAQCPGLPQRLGEHAGRRYAIDPTDCPFVFILEPRPDKPRLRVVPSLAGVGWDARIAGVLLVLIGLLDGAYDGDALFFSRDLVIEGDTAAVLALRNAIEDAELTPSMALGAPARLAPLVNAGFLGAAQRLRRILGAPGETRPSTAPGW